MASGRGARARGHSRDGPAVRRGRRRARAVPHVQSKVWGELDRAPSRNLREERGVARVAMEYLSRASSLHICTKYSLASTTCQYM